MTVLLSAVLLWAIREEMKANRMRPVALMVPVLSLIHIYTTPMGWLA